MLVHLSFRLLKSAGPSILVLSLNLIRTTPARPKIMLCDNTSMLKVGAGVDSNIGPASRIEQTATWPLAYGYGFGYKFQASFKH